MNDFMLLFHGQPTTWQLSPEQMQAVIAQWQAWIGSLAAQGKFVSTNRLMDHGKVVSGSKHAITDGPFTEGKEIIGGYILLKAADLDEAVQLAKGCPVLLHESRVEVRPILPAQG